VGQAKDLAELTATSRQDAFEVERLKKLLEAQEARQQAESERLQNQVTGIAHAHDRAPASLTCCAIVLRRVCIRSRSSAARSSRPKEPCSRCAGDMILQI